MANSVDSDQTASMGAVCSGSTLFTSILNSSVMFCSRRLQQTTFSDALFSWVNSADDRTINSLYIFHLEMF